MRVRFTVAEPLCLNVLLPIFPWFYATIPRSAGLYRISLCRQFDRFHESLLSWTKFEYFESLEFWNFWTFWFSEILWNLTVTEFQDAFGWLKFPDSLKNSQGKVIQENFNCWMFILTNREKRIEYYTWRMSVLCSTLDSQIGKNFQSTLKVLVHWTSSLRLRHLKYPIVGFYIIHT